MKKLSTARKFKMITGQDVMRASKQLEKKQKEKILNWGIHFEVYLIILRLKSYQVLDK